MLLVVAAVCYVVGIGGYELLIRRRAAKPTALTAPTPPASR
jgi:hypothetical protein